LGKYQCGDLPSIFQRRADEKRPLVINRLPGSQPAGHDHLRFETPDIASDDHALNIPESLFSPRRQPHLLSRSLQRSRLRNCFLFQSRRQLRRLTHEFGCLRPHTSHQCSDGSRLPCAFTGRPKGGLSV
jgi:hypothetical protein